MNSTATAPVRATTAPAKPKPKARPAQSKPTAPAASWREQALTSIDFVSDLVQAAIDIDGGPEARTLLRYCRSELEAATFKLREPDASAEAILRDVYDGQHCLLGAWSIAHTPLAIKATIEQAIPLMKSVATLLDVADVKEARAAAGDGEAGFMAGKALAADMLQEALGYADHDVSELEAKYRRRGVPQIEFVSKYLNQLSPGTDMYAGFCAVLSGKLSSAADAGLSPDDAREASYEDCVGGPDTKYEDEVEPSSSTSADPLTVILDRLEDHLKRVAAIYCSPDVTEWTAEALSSCREARGAQGISDAEQCLQRARRFVYKARTNFTVVIPTGDKRLVAFEELTSAHRLLNKALGGVMIEDRGEDARSPLGELIDRLYFYLEAANQIDNGMDDATCPVLNSLHANVSPHFTECEEAEERGDDADAERQLPKLRAGIASSLALCDVNDGRWPLLMVSLDVINGYSPGMRLTYQPAKPDLPDVPAAFKGPAIKKKRLAEAHHP